MEQPVHVRIGVIEFRSIRCENLTNSKACEIWHNIADGNLQHADRTGGGEEIYHALIDRALTNHHSL